MNRPFILTFLFCLLLLISSRCLAEKPLIKHNYGKDTIIEVIDMFDYSNTRSGFHPYLVKISNTRDKPITWNFTFTCSGDRLSSHTFTKSITVESGADIVEELYVPAPVEMRRLIYKISANNGLAQLNNDTSSYGVEPDWPAIAMSKRLAIKSVTALAAKKRSRYSGREHFATTYVDLPTNWKGYTCLDAFMVDEKTWLDISKQQRKAVMTWTRFGGALRIYTDKNAPTFKSLQLENPDKPNTSKKNDQLLGGSYGMGNLKVLKWNGTDLDPNIVSSYKSIHRFDKAILSNFRSKWKLADKFSEKNFNPTIVFFILIIFAILIGPVNLFHFAKAGKRHRLFITTPIISVVAALIIMAIILIQDGIGGSGQRIAFMEIQSDPDQRQLQITQQQISRTGVMFASGFSNPNQPQVSLVNIRANQYSSSNAKFKLNQERFSGDYFRSRNEQGYYLRTVRPTRSRIELQNINSSGEPELFSSLEFYIKNLYYVDAKGVVWKSPTDTNISPGEKIPLKQTTVSDLIADLKGLSDGFSNYERDRIREMQTHRNRYIAEASKPKKQMIQSHDSIRWRDGKMIVSGKAVTP